MLLPLLIPALLMQAPTSPIPNSLEIAPGVFVLKGAPTAETFASLKQAGIQLVIDVRRDGEPGIHHGAEGNQLQMLGIAYYRYAVTPAPPKADFDGVRAILQEHRGTKILIHCGDGNRASALVCSWLILDRNVPPAKAMALAHQGGLRRPDTEEALKHTLAAHGRALS